MSLVDDLVSLRASLPLPPVHHHPAVSASTPRAAPTADGTTHRAPPTVSARDDFTAVAALQCEVGDALDDLIAESAAVYVAGVRPLLVASSSVGCAAAPALESLARAALAGWRNHTSSRTLHGAAAVFAAAENVATTARAVDSGVSTYAAAVHCDAVRTMLALALHVTTSIKARPSAPDSLLWVVRALDAAAHAGALFPERADFLRVAMNALVDCDTGFSVALRGWRERAAAIGAMNSRESRIDQVAVVGERSCSLPLTGARERLLAATACIARAQSGANQVSGPAIGSLLLAATVLRRTAKGSRCGVCGCTQQVDERGDRVCWCDTCNAAGGCRVDGNYDETVAESLSRHARTGSACVKSCVLWGPRETPRVPSGHFRRSVFEGGTADTHEGASNALEAACMEQELSKIAELLDSRLACRGDFLGAAVTRLLAVAAASVLRLVELAPVERRARRAISGALERAAAREAEFADEGAHAASIGDSRDLALLDTEELIRYAVTLAAQEAVRRFGPGAGLLCDAVATRFAPLLYSKEDFAGEGIPRPLIAYVFEPPHCACLEAGVLLALNADGWLVALLRSQSGSRLAVARARARQLVRALRAVGTAAGLLDSLVVALLFHSEEDAVADLVSLIDDVSAQLAVAPLHCECVGALAHSVVAALERFECNDFDVLAKLASLALAFSRQMPPTPPGCFFALAHTISTAPLDVAAVVSAKAVELRRAFTSAAQRSPSVTRRFDHHTALDFFAVAHLWIFGHLNAATSERADSSGGIDAAAFAARSFYPWLRSRVPVGSDDAARRAAHDADNRAVVDRIRAVFDVMQRAGLDDEPASLGDPQPSPEAVFAAFRALACNLSADIFFLADRARAARAGVRARATAARLSRAAFSVMLATPPSAFLRGAPDAPCAVCGCSREVDASGDRVCMCDACAAVGGCHGHASYSDVFRDFSYSRAQLAADVGRPRARNIIELASVLRSARIDTALVEDCRLVADVSQYASKFLPLLTERAACRDAWDVVAALCRSLCLLHNTYVDGGVSVDLARDLLRLALRALPANPRDAAPFAPKSIFPDVHMQVVQVADEKRMATQLSTRALRACFSVVLNGQLSPFTSLNARLTEPILAAEFESLSILVERRDRPTLFAVAASPCDEDDEPRHGEVAHHEVSECVPSDDSSGITLVHEGGIFPARGGTQMPVTPVHYHDTVAAGGLWTRVGLVDVKSQMAALRPGAPRWVTVLRAADLRALGASPTWTLRRFLLTPVETTMKGAEDSAILGVRVQTRAVNRGPLASVFERAVASAAAVRVAYATDDARSMTPPCVLGSDGEALCCCPPDSAAARACEAACSTFVAASARQGSLPFFALDKLLERARALGAVEPLAAAATAMLLTPASSDSAACQSRRCTLWVLRALETALPSSVDSALRGVLSFCALHSSAVARSLAATLESESPAAVDACVSALEAVVRGRASGVLPRGVCVALPPELLGLSMGATFSSPPDSFEESDLDLPSLEATSAHNSSIDSDALPSVIEGAGDGQVAIAAPPVAVVLQWSADGIALVQLQDGGRSLVPAVSLQPVRVISVRVRDIVLKALATAHARARVLADPGLASATQRALVMGGPTGRAYLSECLTPAQARAFFAAFSGGPAPGLPSIPSSLGVESLFAPAAILPSLPLDDGAATLAEPAPSPIDLNTLGWSLAPEMWHVAGRRGRMGVVLSGSVASSSMPVSFSTLGEEVLSFHCSPRRLLTISECIEAVMNSNAAQPLSGVAVLLHSESLWARPPPTRGDSSLRDDDSVSSASDSSSSDERSSAARDSAQSASITSLAFDANRIRTWGGVCVISLPNAHARCRRALRASPSFRACVLLDTASARLLWASVLDWRAWGASLAVGSRVDALLPVGLGWAKATVISAAPEPFRGWFRVAFDSLGADWRVWCPWEIDRIIFGDLTIAPEGWVTGNVSIRTRRRAAVSPLHKVHSPPSALALATGSAAASHGGAAVDAGASDDEPAADDAECDDGVRVTLAPSAEALQGALDAWRAQLAPSSSVCALDKQGKWFEAVVLERRDMPRENDAAEFNILTIRFVGWSPASDVGKYDEHFVLPGDAHRLLPPRTKIRDWRRVQVGDEVERRNDRVVEPALVLAVDVTRAAVVISPIPVPPELLNASAAAAASADGDAVSRWTAAVLAESASNLTTQLEWISLRNSLRIAAHATHRRPRAWADIDTENHGAADDVLRPPAAALAPIEPRLRHVRPALVPAENAATPPLPPPPHRISQQSATAPQLPPVIPRTALASFPAPSSLALPQSAASKDALRTLLSLLRLEAPDHLPFAPDDPSSTLLNAIAAGGLRKTVSPVTIESPKTTARESAAAPARVCLWPRGASVGRASPFPAAVVSLSSESESSSVACAGGPVREVAEAAVRVASPEPAPPPAAPKWDGISLTFSAWLRAPNGATGVVLHQPPSAPIQGDVVVRPPPLPVGLPVVARFAPQDSGSWYRGIVSSAGDGTFDIAYEDGDASVKIDRDRIELRDDAAQSLTLTLCADGLLEATLATLPLAKLQPPFESKAPPSASAASTAPSIMSQPDATIAPPLPSPPDATGALSDAAAAAPPEETDEEPAPVPSAPPPANRSVSSGDLLDDATLTLPPMPRLLGLPAGLYASSARSRAADQAGGFGAEYIDRMNRWQRSSATRARPSVSPPSSTGGKAAVRRKLSIRSTSRVTGADWVHVALAIAPGVMALYVNGVREALVELSPSIETHSRSSSVSVAGSMLTALTDYRTPTARPGFAYLYPPTPSLSTPSAELSRWAPRDLELARATLWPCWLAGPVILASIVEPQRVADNVQVVPVANRGKSDATVDGVEKELDSDAVWSARAEAVFRATETKRAELDELGLFTERVVRDEERGANSASGFSNEEGPSRSAAPPAFTAVPHVLQPLLRGESSAPAHANNVDCTARKADEVVVASKRVPAQRVRHTLLAEGSILFVDVYGARLACRVLSVLSGDMVHLVILPNASAGALAGTCVKADARDLYVPCVDAELSTPPPPPLLPSRSRTAPTTPQHGALQATNGGSSGGGATSLGGALQVTSGGSNAGGATSLGGGSGGGGATPPRSARGSVDAMIASTSPLRGTTPRRRNTAGGRWLSVAQAQAAIDVAEVSGAEAGVGADSDSAVALPSRAAESAASSTDAPLARALLHRALIGSTPINDAGAAAALVRSICADDAIPHSQAARLVLDAMPSREHATAVSCALLRAALGVLVAALSRADETQTPDSKAGGLCEVAAWVCVIAQRPKTHLPRCEEEYIGLAVFAAVALRAHRSVALPVRALPALVRAAGAALNAAALEPGIWKTGALARAADALSPALEEGVAALAASLQHVSCSSSLFVGVPRDKSSHEGSPRQVPASRDSSASRAAMFTAACADAAVRREASTWPPQLPTATVAEALASKTPRNGLSAVNIGGVLFLSCAWPAHRAPHPPAPRLINIPVNRLDPVPQLDAALGTLDLLFSEPGVSSPVSADTRAPPASGAGSGIRGAGAAPPTPALRSNRLEEAILETLHSIADHDRVSSASSNHMSRRLAPAAFVSASTDAILLGANESNGPFARSLQQARRSVWSAVVLHDLSRLHVAALTKSPLSPAVDAAVRATMEESLGRPSSSSLGHGSKPREGRFLFRLFDTLDREQRAAAAALWYRVKTSAREVAAQAGQARPRSRDLDARVGQLLAFNAGVIHALPMLAAESADGGSSDGYAARVTRAIISAEREHVFLPFIRDAVLRAAVDLSSTCTGLPSDAVAAPSRPAGSPSQPPFAAAVSNAVIDALPRYTKKLFAALVDGPHPPVPGAAATTTRAAAPALAPTPAAPPAPVLDPLEDDADEGALIFPAPSDFPVASVPDYGLPPLVADVDLPPFMRLVAVGDDVLPSNEDDVPPQMTRLAASHGAASRASRPPPLLALEISPAVGVPAAPIERECERCTYIGTSSVCELCWWVRGESLPTLAVPAVTAASTAVSSRSPPPLPPPEDIDRPPPTRRIASPRSSRHGLPPPLLTVDNLGPLRFAAFQSFMFGIGSGAGPHTGAPRPLRSVFVVRLHRRPGVGHADGRVPLLPQFRRVLAHVPAFLLRTRGRPFRVVFAHEGGVDAGGLFSEGLTSAAEELSGDASTASMGTLWSIGARHALPRDMSTRASALVAAVSAGELLGIAVRAEHPVPLTLPRAAWRAALGDPAAVERRPLARALGVGLERILPATLLRIAGARALADAVGGARDLDVPALRAKTRYRGWGAVAGTDCSHEESEAHPTVRAFWSVLRALSRRELELVMRFTFARRRLSPTSLPTLTLERMARDDPDASLPAGHTCGAVLELPAYTNEGALKRQLLKAAENCIEYDLDGGTLSE